MASQTVTTLDVNLLIATFVKIEPQAQEFADTFYRILFEKYPRVQSLFSETDMAKQKEKLIDSLKLVMGNINSTTAFTNLLKGLGKRHVGYGAVLNDYPLIGDALLQALAKHLPQDWNAKTEETWTLAYQMIADTMAAGAIEAANEQEQLQSSTEQIVDPLPEDVFVPDRLSWSTSFRLMLLAGIGASLVAGYWVWSNQKPAETNPVNTIESQQ